jgi:hypothetical protein
MRVLEIVLCFDVHCALFAPCALFPAMKAHAAIRPLMFDSLSQPNR